jgi:multiple sugar transport system permease protein
VTQNYQYLPSTLVATAARPAVRRSPPRIRPARVMLHAFLIAMVAVWLFPLFWAIYSSLRPISDTIQHGYLSWPSSLGLTNYATVWTQAEIPYFYLNTLVIVVPGVIFTLLLASMVAFCCTQFSWRFNLIVLMLFTAGNLLPPQVIIVPLYWIYLHTPIAMLGSIDAGRFSFALFSDNTLLYDQYIGIILIHVVFQTGFATFVLSNYMKTITKEITESALVDGANVLRIWWSVILPLCRPALAAMATLLFTFMYNDFFWALILLKTGDKRPITSALNNLQGEFFVNNNLIAAGALLACIPPIVVYILLQRYFVAGLTLGSTKG